MEQKPRVGIVAALRREIAPLVRQRRTVCLGQPNRRILIFESDGWVAGCGGMGKEAAQAVSKVLIDEYGVNALISCGLAGGLTSQMKLAQTFVAGRVIDATSGKEWSNAAGAVTLVSFPSILGPQEKREVASKFSAQAVDMEAAAVAEVAAQAGVPFVALKSISDELDFPMPPLQRFIQVSHARRSGKWRSKQIPGARLARSPGTIIRRVDPLSRRPAPRPRSRHCE